MQKILLLLMFFSYQLLATENIIPQEVKYNQKAQIILETINKLEKNGYITNKNSLEAKKEMVFNDKSMKLIKNDPQNKIKETSSNEITSSEFFSLINIIKIIAVIFFLIAFRGIVMKFLYLFTKIPEYVYQSLLLSLSIYLTFSPEIISVSESFYISNFAVFSNLILLFWIVIAYEKFFLKILSFISFNIPLQLIGSFYLTLYFSVFTIYLESQFLGIISLISFVSMLGFSMETSGLTTYIGYEDEDYLEISMFINGIILLSYSYITINNINIPYLNLFSTGIEYVSSIAFIIALLISSSFVFKDKPKFFLSLFLMVMSFLLSITSSILFNLEVIPAIINTGFFIFALGWLGFLTSKINGIVMSLSIGLSLYISALIIEKHPELFITTLF